MTVNLTEWILYLENEQVFKQVIQGQIILQPQVLQYETLYVGKIKHSEAQTAAYHKFMVILPL